MVLPSDRSAEEVKRLNQEMEERQYEFRSNCNDGDGDASACHSWGEWLAVVDKKYTDAGDDNLSSYTFFSNAGIFIRFALSFLGATFHPDSHSIRA